MAKKQFDITDITGLSEFEFPEADFFKKPKRKSAHKHELTHTANNKHDEAYEAFIQWSATPSKLREPKTMKEFEKVWKLPDRYTSNEFKRRADFHERRLKTFWDWMFDKFPDVIYAVYTRAITKSTADAKIFAELVGKRLEVDQPKSRMTPFVMVGVPQEKINNLFVPESYEEAELAEDE